MGCEVRQSVCMQLLGRVSLPVQNCLLTLYDNFNEINRYHDKTFSPNQCDVFANPEYCRTKRCHRNNQPAKGKAGNSGCAWRAYYGADNRE